MGARWGTLVHTGTSVLKRKLKAKGRRRGWMGVVRVFGKFKLRKQIRTSCLGDEVIAKIPLYRTF